RDISAYTVQCKSAHTTCCLMGRNTPEIVHSDPYHSNLDDRHKKRNYQLLHIKALHRVACTGHSLQIQPIWCIHTQLYVCGHFG
ncbi:hypothetical protein AX14_001099, partial [Amanita brunnescens Koide BX004]